MDSYENLRLGKLKKRSIMNNYLNKNEDDNASNSSQLFESKKVLYGLNARAHNPETHVRVRILHYEELPVDLDTGLRYIDNSLKFDDHI